MTKLIALCDGHGMETAGKRTPPISSLGGRVIHENEFNRAVIKFLDIELQRCGFKTLLVAPTDEDIPLKARVDLANSMNADVYISIHYNAYDGKFDEYDPEGLSVHVYPNSKEGRKLAECVLRYLKEGTPQKNRGIVEDNFYVLRKTKMPAILSENGFMDNKREALLMIDEDFQKEVAIEHAKGICDYFNIPYAEPKTELKQLYRIRKSWEDVESQIGAYYNLDNAKLMADNNDEYNVYDENGELIYPERRNIMQLVYSRVLKKGLRGDDIKQLQNSLISLGYDIGKSGADGIAGNMTDLAIRAFQRDNKLTVDGLAGRSTISKINELLSKPTSQQTSKPKKYKYGNADVIEVDPLNLYIDVVKMAGNKIKGDFINGSLFSHSKMISISTLVSNGKILAEHLPHDNVKRGTFVVWKNGTVSVEMIDFISKYPKLKDIKFAIGGFNIMPQGKTVRQQLKDEWFDYNTVGYRTWRSMIGWSKAKNKVLIVIAPNTDAEEGNKLMKNLGCDIAVGLDSGLSTNGKFNDETIRLTSRILHNIIRWN